RCLQRPHDGAESAPVALRGATATGRDPSPAHRLHPEGARRSAQPRDALPSSPTARHLQPLPAARRGDTAMATKSIGVSQPPFEALPLKQRQTIAYHYLVGMPYLQVAEIVGGSEDAARRAAADGIATLRKTFPKGESR